MKRCLLTLLVILVLAIPAQAQEKIYLPLVLKEDSCMGIAKLAISDGTTEISLLDLTGIHLAEDDGWTPKIIQAKSGGVFQDSSMAAGRRLVYRQFGTAREDFTFNIMSISQDELIAETSDLLQLLEKAVNYWATDWQSDIVYLIAQSDCETYARYAPILYYEAQELQNPYGQPFVQAGEGAIFDDIGIMIERGHWQSTIPGTGECVETSSIYAYNYSEYVEVYDAGTINDIINLVKTSTGRLLAQDSGNSSPEYYSDDDGDNWAILLAGSGENPKSIYSLASGRLLSVKTVAAVTHIYYSDNDAANWTDTGFGPTNATTFFQTSTGRILRGDTGFIDYSDDNGVNWATLTTSPANVVRGFLETTTGRILATDYPNLMVSDDDGATWTYVLFGYTPTGNPIQSSTGRIFQPVVWANGTSYGIYASDDNGDNWYFLHKFSSGQMSQITELEAGVLFGVLSDATGEVVFSFDDGVTWTKEYDLPSYSNSSVIADDGNIVFGGGGNGLIFKRYESETTISTTDSSCTDIIRIANKQNTSNLTHIHIDDGGVFGSNLFPMIAFPQDLLPAAPVANDAIYFGSSTGTANSGPFSNLVFDIDDPVIAVGNYEIRWEYYTGATWATLTTHDETYSTSTGSGRFQVLGVGSVHWIPPSDWATVAVNSVTAYWVRARVVSVTTSITAPSQQNRTVYTSVLPFVTIDDLQVSGDISATAQEKVTNRSDEDGPGGDSPNLYNNRILIGLRSYDRGNGFQSYLNISDVQPTTGISLSLGTNTTFGNDIVAPTGRSATYNPGGVEAMGTRATATLSTTIARDFYGSYHAFLRVQRTAGASTDFNVQLVFVTGSGGIQKTTESKQVQTTTAFELLDFGQVTIPVGGSLASSDLGDQIQILIQASAASGVPNLVLYDLILIPVDEWAIDSVDQTNSSTSDIGRSGDISKLLDIDSVTDPKNPIKSIVRQVGSEFVTANYNPITNGPAILQSNVDQRLWFLAAKTSATGSSYTWIAPPEIVHSIQLFKAQRYLGLRGNR